MTGDNLRVARWLFAVAIVLLTSAIMNVIVVIVQLGGCT